MPRPRTIAIAAVVVVVVLLAGTAVVTSTLTVATASEPAAHLTGTHWPDSNEYAKLKQIGYGFAITNVHPGDIAEARAKLDAAKAAGIRLIIGIYAFGGPEPYVWNGSGWTISAAAQQSLDYFETRESEILALFGYNEPYWVDQASGAANDPGRSYPRHSSGRSARRSRRSGLPRRSTTTSAGLLSGHQAATCTTPTRASVTSTPTRPVSPTTSESGTTRSRRAATRRHRPSPGSRRNPATS